VIFQSAVDRVKFLACVLFFSLPCSHNYLIFGLKVMKVNSSSVIKENLSPDLLDFCQ